MSRESFDRAAEKNNVVEQKRSTSLAIVERGFRGALEEQYANMVWLSECMRKMRAEHDLLLCGTAVTCAFAEQCRQSLKIGELEISTVGHFPDAVAQLQREGGRVFVLERDLNMFRHPPTLLPGVEPVSNLAKLIIQYNKSWFW